ncbi:hypothetical protein CPD7_13 [Clostridium phage CPD7]|uniref:Uncharacterized protein n=1 Tax=Clostridium phage CPD7 TaxID=2483608 RepID=A0A5H2TSS9_9CAUD|nr:hypothetical protein CPD7_13 [Clostridium phage CPD7]
MNKNDRLKLMKVFDNICKNNQYVQHYKGCRIISYNDPEHENVIFQFHHNCNDFCYAHSFILNDFYNNIDLDSFIEYYNLSLEIFRDKLQNYIDNELTIENN